MGPGGSMPSQPTTMPTCEAIQIAHEMHVHGAPAELSAGDVDSHVTTCADCRAYVAESKRIDDMHVFAVPESEFARLRTEVITKRLPRFRREIFIGTLLMVPAVLFGVVTGMWGGPIGGFIGLLFMFRQLDRRSRKLEAAMATNGRDLLATMREDLRYEIDFRHKFDVLLIMVLVGALVAAIYIATPVTFAVLGVAVAACVEQVVVLHRRKRELRTIG